jgi:nucleoside-diphosphate-sugar epimerase
LVVRGVNCLVTGGTGFLGQHLTRRLAADGHDVTILSRRRGHAHAPLVGDLAAHDLDLGSCSFSTVYHLAAMTHWVPHYSAERAAIFRVNVQGTKNLLRALERGRQLPQAVVLASSVAVYGVEEGVLLDETTPRNATDPYGASKREAEEILLRWCAGHSVRAAIVRLPLLLGAGAKGNVAAMVRALARGWYFGVGPGNARQSMVLAADVARIMPRAAQVGGVFHLTDGCHPTLAELEQALSAAMKRRAPRRLPIGLARVGARIGDLLHRACGVRVPLNSRTLLKMTCTLTFSDLRARHELGWTPCPVLDRVGEMLEMR